ncbi:MAG TPA: hypothetical protein VMH30_04060 [Verrucomicrobiae bacterium]|nr:hypothetical protein [Verrucomicrobiae bacterium]
MDFSGAMDDNALSSFSHTTSPFATNTFMIKKPAAAVAALPPVIETEAQRFERILLRGEFKTLKALLDHLGRESAAMNAALITTNSYQMFLGKLGYRVVIVKQIHENDCYSRLGPAGGIRAVLPVHDMATYSTLVTLVNFDSTITTTTNAVDYYDEQLAGFKSQLMNKSGDAA